MSLRLGEQHPRIACTGQCASLRGQQRGTLDTPWSSRLEARIAMTGTAAIASMRNDTRASVLTSRHVPSRINTATAAPRIAAEPVVAPRP